MTSPRSQDVGKLLLRLVVGTLLLLHGINKLQHGIDWMKPELATRHLPQFIRYGVFLGEVVGSILVLGGILSRIGGVLIAGNMVFAIYVSHLHEILKLNPYSGGSRIEPDLLFLFGGIAIACLGAGQYAFSRGQGRYD